MKKILLLSLLALVGYYWILFFRFCHPYPKTEFFIVIGVQFGVCFVPYLFSNRFGRIITIIFGLTLVRLGSILGIQSPMVTLMGVFWGGVAGNLFRELYTFYKIKKNNLDVAKERFYFSGNNILISFLVLITIERFLIYFNAPYLNGFGILETMFVKGVSSKEAFALSMESITHILFPLLYFHSEEIRGENSSEQIKDWKIGILIALGIQACILFLQILWDRNFLAENTNLSLEANRVMGLFRDSGSSTWIIPVLCFLFYEDLLLIKKKFHFPLIGFIFLECCIGPYQGRGYWLLFLVSIFFLGIMIWQKNRLKLSIVKFIFITAIIGIILITLYVLPKDPNSSLEKLLSIPIRVLNFLTTGDVSILLFDPHRFYFNLAAWKVFLENPLWGSGLGSFIVNLKDPSLNLYTPEGKIDNPSLFLGLMSEVGVLGLIIITLSLFLNSSLRKKWMFVILLFFAFSFGYHIVQPDGGFAVVLIWLLAFGTQQESDRNEFFSKMKYTLIFLLVLFLISLFWSILPLPTVAEFRKEKLDSYQLLAYEQNKVVGKNRYHIFKGKTIWVLGKATRIKLEVFLDNSTSKNTLKQKWSFLYKSNKPISESQITVTKKKSKYILFDVPNNAYYLQVEELDEEGHTRFYGDVPFCIPRIHFTKENKFL